MQFQKVSLTEPYDITLVLKYVEKETLSEEQNIKNSFQTRWRYYFFKNLSS